MAYISILLIVIILLLGILIYLNLRSDPEKVSSKESFRDLDKAVERQEATLSDLSKDIQSFQDGHWRPLSKIFFIPINSLLMLKLYQAQAKEWSLPLSYQKACSCP